METDTRQWRRIRPVETLKSGTIVRRTRAPKNEVWLDAGIGADSVGTVVHHTAGDSVVHVSYFVAPRSPFEKSIDGAWVSAVAALEVLDESR